MMVWNDTTIDGVMQMLQTLTPPYVRYLRREQPWPETVVLWPFGKEWRQAARRAKAERIAREALNRPDIHALVLRQAQDILTDAFQIAELLIRTITSHVLAKRVALPLIDPHEYARKRLVPNKSFETDAAKSAAPLTSNVRPFCPVLRKAPISEGVKEGGV
jgi:hypothetical protein